MATATYSAGTAYLTVVPSFLNLESALSQGVRDAAAKADKDLASQFAQGFKDTQNAAKAAGQKTGQNFSGAYADEATKRLTTAWKSLPEPQPDVSLSKWDKALGQVRSEMKDLSEQRIGVDIDQKTFDAAIADFKKRLEDLRDTASGPNSDIGFFNADQAAQSLAELQKFTDDASRLAGDGGEQVGSAFQQRLSKALSGGVDKLPELKITADSTDAEAKIAEVRERMVELQGKRIGVDIDAGEAVAEIKALQAELDALDRKNVQVDIRTNARDAAAELAAFTAAADEASSSTGGIGENANFSLSRLELLIAAGAALGSAIVPAAAAAAGAVGTIGTVAAAALAGVGVFALGISGISSAVQALNQYSSDQAKSEQSISQANQQVASSTAQVQQAESSLANTRRQVSQAAQDAAEQVTKAEQGVADARRNAANEQRDAAQAVADARQQVADAQRDIADAQRENARDLSDADQQVKDAQESLTEAEQNAIDVRTKLNQAIEDAVNNMKELQVSLDKNSADTEKATAEQMTALDQLNALKANPRATEAELLAAKASYDEQTAELEDLAQKRAEMAQQQVKYTKQGVDGDQEVVDARKQVAAANKSVSDAQIKVAKEESDLRDTQIKNEERLADAQERAGKAQEAVSKALISQHETEINSQEKIADAEQAVADARKQQSRQQQDGQYQLRQAVNAVTAAQQAQQQAWQKTGTAGGSALDTLNQKMSALSPIGQQFAKFIFGLKGDFQELQASASDPLLPQLQTAITILLQYLPQVEAFVGKVADKLGELGIRAAKALGDPVFQRFFNYIDQTAVPSLEQMFEVGQNVTEGLVALFLALTPFNQDVGSGIVKLSQDFAKWALTFDQTQGYQQFLQYIRDNGPTVVHLLGDLGSFAINLIKASAPLGSIVLKVLADLVAVLNSLPTPVLTALVIAIGAVAAGMTALSGVIRLLKLKDDLTDIFGGKVSSLVQKFAVDTGRATDETSNFGKATATVGGMASTASEKVQGMGSSVASLASRAKDAVSAGMTPLSHSFDTVYQAALNANTATDESATVIQNASQRISGLGAAAGTAASTGLSKARGAMMDVAVAANGPGGIAAGVQAAGSKLATFGKAAGGVASTVGNQLKSGLGSVVSFLGGPWGIALTVATIALTDFAQKSADEKNKVDSLTAVLGDLADKYKDLSVNGEQAGAAADDAFKQIVQNNPQMQQAVVALNQLGISFNDMVQAAASGDPSAVLKKIDDAIASIHQQELTVVAGPNNPYTKQREQLETIRKAYLANAGAVNTATQAQNILNTSDQRAVDITQIKNANQGKSLQVQNALIDQYDTTATSINALSGLINVFNNAESTAAQRATAVQAAIDAQTGAQINATDSAETLAGKMVDLADQVNQAKAAGDKNATSIALNTTRLDQNSATALRNRDALEDVAKSIRDMYVQDIASGKPLADVTKAHNDRIKALETEATKLGFTKSQTEQLIATYGKVPDNINTVVKMDPNSFNAVYKNLQRMQFMQSELKIGRTADQAEADWNDYQREINRALLKAGGGPIDGPGTATSDSILTRLSKGEWVHKAAAVDYYGDAAMSAINNMQVPREQLRPPGRAAGGPVGRRDQVPGFTNGGKVQTLTVPVPVNINGTWVPDAAWVNAHTEVPNIDGAFTGLSPDASVAKLQKFALNQRGKRYLWAAVGPESYDCSGLVGNLWALATGHSLYHRYMTTDNMGPGRHGMVAGPGKKMTVYLGPGHTAAVVGGLHVEAYGGNGTPLAIGRIGTPLSYYNQKLHLPGFAEGGRVDLADVSALRNTQNRLISWLKFGWPEPPDGPGVANLTAAASAGQFDAGGFLPPGYSTVVNNTGSPEPVLTGQQWKDISQLARLAASGRGGNTYNYEFRDTTLTPGFLRAQQDREAVLARANRPG